MRERYQKQLEELKGKIYQMGRNVLFSIEKIGEKENGVTKDRDFLVSEKMKETERLYEEIIQLVHNLILREQPVSHDLRFIESSKEISNNLLRLSSQGRGVLSSPDRNENEYLVRMASEIGEMLRLSLVAFEKGSNKEFPETREKETEDNDGKESLSYLEIAEKVIKMDDSIDEEFHAIKNALSSMMVYGGEERKNAEKALGFMLTAKYYERMGDHIVNIAKIIRKL